MRTLNQFYGNIKSIQHSPIFTRSTSSGDEYHTWTITPVNTAKSLISLGNLHGNYGGTGSAIHARFQTTSVIELTSFEGAVNHTFSCSVIEYN